MSNNEIFHDFYRNPVEWFTEKGVRHILLLGSDELDRMNERIPDGIDFFNDSGFKVEVPRESILSVGISGKTIVAKLKRSSKIILWPYWEFVFENIELAPNIINKYLRIFDDYMFENDLSIKQLLKSKHALAEFRRSVIYDKQFRIDNLLNRMSVALLHRPTINEDTVVYDYYGCRFAKYQQKWYTGKVCNTLLTGDLELRHGESLNMLNQNAIQPQFVEEVSALRIPQFFMKSPPDLFGGEYELLEKENLSEGFSLSGQDAQISFELATEEIYRVDLQEKGEAIPKYMRASKEESEYIRERLAKLPSEEKLRRCVTQICAHLNRNDRYAAQEISAYVHRVVENMTEDEQTAMETAIPTYARKIQNKIDELERTYRTAQFKKWLDSGKVVCRESYALPLVITPPAETIDAIPYSLYDAEKDDMNPDERNLIDIVVGLGNVKWWHRIIERRGFRLNGNINHYPDFMVMTKAGKLVLIEFKGDDRDNSDSKIKLELGRQWQAQAGPNYRYFMVFD